MVKPGFDVAVVVVDRQITFNTYIQTVCLPTPETATISFDFPKQPMVVKGVGKQSVGLRKTAIGENTSRAEGVEGDTAGRRGEQHRLSDTSGQPYPAQIAPHARLEGGA